MDVYSKMKDLGIKFPLCPVEGGLYKLAKPFGDNLIYVSGCGPDISDAAPLRGRVGSELSVEDGQLAAKNCLLNVLSVLDNHVGDLNRISSFVKLLVFVASSSDFQSQPQVADAATKLLIEIFGEEIGCPARSAVGIYVLPGDIPVEIEALVELKP